MADQSDPIAGLDSRQTVLDQLDPEGKPGSGQAHRRSLVQCGPDDLPRIRDEYGADVAERIRQTFAGVLARMSRDVDRVATWGEDEFLMALPLTGSEGAAKLAERVRQEAAFLEYAGVPERVTASFGVAEMDAGESPEGVIQRAREALLQARHAGGNEVVVALAPTMEMPALD